MSLRGLSWQRRTTYRIESSILLEPIMEQVWCIIFITNKASNPDFEKHEFSYRGPNPFTKETAILMMCDSVEAASKSLKDPTSTKINDFVDRHF